jgi:hypothetical protein
LILSNLTARDALNKESDLVARQFRAIAFLANDVLGPQLFSSERSTID